MSEVRRWGELDCVVVDRTDDRRPQAATILCHGFGAPGTDLVPIADEMMRAEPLLRQMLFIFPQAPIRLDPFYDSRAWWMIDVEKIQSLMASGEFRELRNSVPPDLDERRRQLDSVIEGVMSAYDLTADRIVIGGFSQGAVLATEVSLHYPQPLAGLIVWSGTLLNETGWRAAAARKPTMRVVQSHGRADPLLPLQGAESLRNLWQQHGHDVQFIPFSGGHEINADALWATVTLLTSVLSDRKPPNE